VSKPDPIADAVARDVAQLMLGTKQKRRKRLLPNRCFDCARVTRHVRCTDCARAAREAKSTPTTEGDTMTEASPQARAEVQRILDGIARDWMNEQLDAQRLLDKASASLEARAAAQAVLDEHAERQRRTSDEATAERERVSALSRRERAEHEQLMEERRATHASNVQIVRVELLGLKRASA
jgi:hypothetical protein